MARYYNISGELTQELLAAGNGVTVDSISLVNIHASTPCSIDLYIEKSSIVAKINHKSYWLMNGDETAEAMKALNRLLTQPIPSTGEEDEGETTDTEMEPEEPAEEEPA